MWIKASIPQRGRNVFQMGEKYGEKQRGNLGFRGRPSRHWMVISIQASVSGSICQFLQIYACFDCVVINHQKGGDCNEHGPIRLFLEILVIE